MTKRENHIDPAKINLLHIEEVKVNLSDSPSHGEVQITPDIAHISGYNLEEKKYFIGLQLKLTLLDDEEQESELFFRYNFHFKVENLDKMYTRKEERILSFSRVFVSTLAGISYSTLRGIVYEKTTGNFNTPIVLPVIDPSIILDSWIKNA